MNINLTPTAHSMEVINRSTLEFDNFEDLKAACDKFDYSIGDIVKIRSNGKIEYRELSETIDLDSILWERSPGLTVYWNLVEVSSRKYTFGTIEEMKKAKYLKVGDVVELLGFYTSGDGAHHKRKISATDDGSGEVLSNGLYGCIVHNGEVNVMWMGAKGDGTSDDSDIFLKVLEYMSRYSGMHRSIKVPPKIFKITKDITISFGYLTISGGGTLKYDDRYVDTHIKKCLHFQGLKNPGDPIRNITIDDITIDMRLQKNKGGATLENLGLTSTKPIFPGGAWGISAEFITNINITNCSVIDVYGDGIRIKRGFNVTIEKNKVIDCGGSGIGHGMLNDNFGDGIVCFFSKKCYVSNNFVKNSRKFKDPTDYGNIVIPQGYVITDYLCGRSGLEFEYATNTDNIENKDVVEYIDKREVGIIFDNNWVEGYAKGIHLEASTLANVTNNTVIGNYVHMMIQHVMGCPIYGNILDGRNLPNWLQSGYHIYTNSLAISEYGGPQRDSVGNMSFVQSNRFLNGSKILYNTYSTKILNNYFENGTIYETGTGWAGELIVENNIFLNNDINYFNGGVAANIRNYGNNKVSIKGNSFLNAEFQKSLKNDGTDHIKECVEFKAINLERIPDIAIIEDNYFIGCRSHANANYKNGKILYKNNLFKNYGSSIYVSQQNHNCDIINNRFHSYGVGTVIDMPEVQGRLSSEVNVCNNWFFIHKPETPSDVKYLMASNNSNYENKVTFNSNIITISEDVLSEVTVFNTFWRLAYNSTVNDNVFVNLLADRLFSKNKLMNHMSIGSGFISNGNLNCKTVDTQTFSIPNGLFLHKGYTKVFERPCSDGSIGFTVTSEGTTGLDVTFEKIYYSKVPSSSIIELDTPIYTSLMKKEGVYEDFETYMFAKLEYDAQQREVQAQQEANYKIALEGNPELSFEEFLSQQPMLLPVIPEPVPSEALLAFKVKYVG